MLYFHSKQVLISDRPNGIADLTKVIAETGVTIKDISQERAWVTTDAHSVEVSVNANNFAVASERE